MPWKSQAQAAWGHSPEGMKALGGAKKVAEWDASTEGKSLPKRKSQYRALYNKRKKEGKTPTA